MTLELSEAVHCFKHYKFNAIASISKEAIAQTFRYPKAEG
jgi:hypothetical protein